MMIPLFFSEAAKEEEYDNFNYFVSQCRIRIEMAFGLMTGKFGMLQRKYSGPKIRRIKRLMVVIARMHIFVINKRLRKNLELDNTPTNVNFHQPTTNHNSLGVPLDGNSKLSTVSL